MSSSASSSAKKLPGLKSRVLAAFLSLFLPGLGQIYCEQDNKGVFLAGMALLGFWSSGGRSAWVLSPLIAWDAYLIARKLNAGILPGRWEFFSSIRPLNAIPPRVILMAIVTLIAALTVYAIVHFASGYPPAE